VLDFPIVRPYREGGKGKKKKGERKEKTILPVGGSVPGKIPKWGVVATQTRRKGKEKGETGPRAGKVAATRRTSTAFFECLSLWLNRSGKERGEKKRKRGGGRGVHRRLYQFFGDSIAIIFFCLRL